MTVTLCGASTVRERSGRRTPPTVEKLGRHFAVQARASPAEGVESAPKMNGRHLTGGMRCRPRRSTIGGIGHAKAGMRIRLSSSVRKATVLTKPAALPTFGSMRQEVTGIDSP